VSDTAQVETTPDAGQGPEPEAPTTPEPVDTGTEPTGDLNAGVQPATTDEPAQPDGGQGLIEPYLEGVDEAHRDIVADVLNRYRQDSDAQITGKFEELNAYKSFVPEGRGVEYLETPVALYENLMENPKETVNWIFEQFSNAGIDLRSQVLEGASTETPPETPGEENPDDPADRPLTRRELEQWQREQREQEEAAQQAEQRRKTAQTWFKEAADEHGLELGEGDSHVTEAILKHAAQLMPQYRHLGQSAGKQAIATAVQAFTNKFGKTPSAPAGDTTPEPRVADGGAPPAPAEVSDLSDPKDRKAFMASFLQGSSNVQE